jgi:hypothetical protein
MTAPLEIQAQPAGRIKVELSDSQRAAKEDGLIISMSFQADVKSGYELRALRLHSFAKGCGLNLGPIDSGGLVSSALSFYGPQEAIAGGELTNVQSVDRLFKRKLQLISNQPLSNQDNQYSVTSVNVVSAGREWEVIAAKSSGNDAKTWKMKLEGSFLKVSGKDDYKELIADDTSGEVKFYRKNHPLETLEVYSLAKDFGIATDVSELEMMIWRQELESSRRAKDGYNVARMRSHMRNLGIDVEDGEDEKLLRKSLAQYSRRRGNGPKAAGLLMIMPALGMEVTAAERQKAEMTIRKALLENRQAQDGEPDRDGETAAWLRMALHKVYHDESLGSQLAGLPAEQPNHAVEQMTGGELPGALDLKPITAGGGLVGLFQTLSEQAQGTDPPAINRTAWGIVSQIEVAQESLQEYIDNGLIQHRDAFLRENESRLGELNIHGKTVTSIRSELGGRGGIRTEAERELLRDCNRFLDDEGIFLSALMRRIPDDKVEVDMTKTGEELNYIGSFLDRNMEISILGPVGDHFAAHSQQGTITVKGDVGENAFASLKGAQAIVEGNCGRQAGEGASAGLAVVKGEMGEVGVPRENNFVLLQGAKDAIILPKVCVSDAVKETLDAGLNNPLIHGTAGLYVGGQMIKMGSWGLRFSEGTIPRNRRQYLGIRVETTDAEMSPKIQQLMGDVTGKRIHPGLDANVFEITFEHGPRGNFYELYCEKKELSDEDRKNIADVANMIFRLQKKPETT